MNVNTDTYIKWTYQNSDVPSLVFVEDIGRFKCDSDRLNNDDFRPLRFFSTYLSTLSNNTTRYDALSYSPNCGLQHIGRLVDRLGASVSQHLTS